MTKEYEYVKAWRGKNKRTRTYARKWQQQRRAHFRNLYLTGKITYAKIPKSYRYFKDTRKGR
jgi:hypothetical protein